MRLYFPDPTSAAAINVARLRKCGYDIGRIMAKNIQTETVDTLVVLCDGTPDDRVIGVLAHHLDGDNLVGVVKPAEKHIAVIGQLTTYLGNLLASRFRKIMFLIDQESCSLEDLYTEAQVKMANAGVTFSLGEDDNRLRVYDCSVTGGRTFQVIIVVNGLDDVSTANHCIEDHLARAANIEITGNSKHSWNSLNSNQQRQIFRNLNRELREVERLFPQQTSGCRCLEDDS